MTPKIETHRLEMAVKQIGFQMTHQQADQIMLFVVKEILRELREIEKGRMIDLESIVRYWEDVKKEIEYENRNT